MAKLYVKDKMIATYKVDNTWQEIEDGLVQTPIGSVLKSEYNTLDFQRKLEDFKNTVEKHNLIEIKKQRLEELRKDIVQDIAGLVIDDIEDKKAEYRYLLNEIRLLQGKEPRKIKE